MKRHTVKPGNAHRRVYNQAINALQRKGFKTELYISKSKVTLRWVKESAKWYAGTELVDLALALEEIGTRALAWMAARDGGIDDETQYATQEEG